MKTYCHPATRECMEVFIVGQAKLKLLNIKINQVHGQYIILHLLICLSIQCSVICDRICKN